MADKKPKTQSDEQDQTLSILGTKAEEGDAQAQYELGMRYIKGNGVDQSYEEAVMWFKRSAKQGYSGGQRALGLCYRHGYGIEQSDEDAVKWCRLAAEQGDAESQFYLGWMFYKGIGIKQSYEDAVKWYRLAAEQGLAGAQRNLGWCYRDGEGVEQSDEEAVKWFEKSAKQGDSNGQNVLGSCYENGRGVTKSIKNATKWYALAAKQGHSTAITNLTRIYKDMKHSIKDCDMLELMTQTFSESGVIEAKKDLAIIMEKNGKSTSKLIQIYQEIDPNDPMIMMHISRLYHEKSDEDNFEMTYKKAVDEGLIFDLLSTTDPDRASAEVLFFLGWIFEIGKSVEHNLSAAKKFYEKSKDKGYPLADKYLKKIGPKNNNKK